MQAKLYHRTGFNSVDIPDSIKVLEQNFVADTFMDINIVQSDYLAELKVADIEYWKARTIDYVVLEDFDAPAGEQKICYTVSRFEMIAPDVCKFILLLDAYNTIGGFNADSGNLIISGSANRMSVSVAEDNAKFFTLNEPFSPAEKTNIITDDLHKPADYNQTIPIIETVTIPPRIVEAKVKQGAQNITLYNANIAKHYMGHSTGEYIMKQQTQTNAGTIESVTVGQNIQPMARTLKNTTLANTGIDNNTYEIELGTRWWTEWKTKYTKTVDGETVTGNLIQDFRDNGKEQDVINFWRIPLFFLSILTDSDYDPTAITAYGGIDKIENKILLTSLSITPHTVYNNKARYSQSVSVKVISPVSASQLDKKVFEIVDAGTTPAQATYTASCYIGADIRPNGSPFFLFRYINQNEQVKNKTYEIINGGAWRKITLTAEGVSNKNYENARINQQANMAKMSAGMQIGIGAAGLAAVVLSGGTAGVVAATAGMMAGNLLGGITGYAKADYNQAEQQRLLAMQGEQASTQLTISNSEYLRDIADNYFVAIIATYSDTDMEAYDTFLTKYGYNVGNKPITNADFYSRPAFNYMRINDITIESVHNNSNLINKVKEQLQAGVRIWHKKPTPQDMFAGGNR